ncbi:MAG: EAL domain-containing protein [Gammaproteobacteria bacterium]|nr:EAL domain-containing protein [Gammaproteobacteria bacterium]
MNKIKSKSSIKNRFLTILTICSIIILVSTITAQIIVSNMTTLSARNIELRQKALVESQHIRTNLRSANDILTDHLLRPSANVKEYWQNKISEVISRVDSLAKSLWVKERNLVPLIMQLKQNITTYDQQAKRLIDLRMIAQQQHPSLYYARETMLPKNKSFLTANSLAIEEILDESNQNIHSRLYLSMTRIQYLWTQIISNFRMYIINRLGSFDEKSLLVQESDIETFHKTLIDEITELLTNNKKMNLDIQTEASLEVMLKASVDWIKDFEVVKSINSSPSWRMDVEIINNTIRPLDKKILIYLQDLEYQISDSAAYDVNNLTLIGEGIIIALWALMFIGWITAALSFAYLNRSVLKPISILTRALKAETTADSQQIILPEIQYDETQSLIEAFSSMRKQIHIRQTALEHQALHDELTGLPNRNLLFDRVKQHINNTHREDNTMALLMMDLDRFKEINDTLGHQIGDRILEQVSKRIKETLRDTDTVARLGGDEFAMVVPLKKPEHTELVANKILSSLDRPFNVSGYQLFVGGSIGIALYPEHSDNVDTLLQRADVAMYVAKRNNTGFEIYNASQDEDNMGRLALSNDLRKALNSEELVVHYQPKLDMKTGQTRGVEALIRWNHPERGYIAPDQIIYIAEHTGLIKPLTRWVLQTAISQCSQWHSMGLSLSVAVNLSTQNLQDPSLASIIQSTLSTYNFPPEYLVLEITESAVMLEPEQANKVLTLLDSMGVWISIDDYGTGFSSLAYLKHLPVDELKIDKSFVMNMQKDDNDAVIVRSTVDLAKNLGLKVVAEGIEDQGTWDTLSILGCDYAQGFYMSKALSASEFEKWIKHNQSKKSVLV